MTAADLINEAKKPFCLVGQGVLLGGAEEELKAFLQKNDIPAGSTVLGLSALPTDFPLNKGNARYAWKRRAETGKRMSVMY